MPKQYYVYLPFLPQTNTKELKNGIQRWQENIDMQWGKNNFYQTLIETLKPKSLDTGISKYEMDANLKKIEDFGKKLVQAPELCKKPILIKHSNGVLKSKLGRLIPDNYVLYVVGHCAPGSLTLRNTRSFSIATEALTGQNLVDRMGEAGLPRNILNIKLLACFGASLNPFNESQRAFSDSLWKALRGYCTNLVKMTAYTEAVMLSSFYKRQRDGKTYTKVALGETLPDRLTVSGKLREVRKLYRARPCFYCGRPVMKRCSKCENEFCSQKCFREHLDDKGLCSLYTRRSRFFEIC